MDALRTPDDRFTDIPDWPYEPRYLEVDDGEGGSLRVHFVDEGPPDAATAVWLLHGEPTWGFLYRKMIPPLLAAGHRVLVPDLVGFGRSDKPTKKPDYTFGRHVGWMHSWFRQLGLDRVTFFGQDWGSLIGLTVCALEADRIDRIVIANGVLPDPRRLDQMNAARQASSSDPDAFDRWEAFASSQEHLDASGLVNGDLLGDEAARLHLSPAELAAYDAPFPDASYQAGALVFPSLAKPSVSGMEMIELFTQTWGVLDEWEKPFLCAFGKQDPVLGWADQLFIDNVPGAAGLPHRQFDDASHFVQEQKGPELATIVNELISATSR